MSWIHPVIMKIFVASGAYLKSGVFILWIGLQQWDLPGFPMGMRNGLGVLCTLWFLVHVVLWWYLDSFGHDMRGWNKSTGSCWCCKVNQECDVTLRSSSTLSNIRDQHSLCASYVYSRHPALCLVPSFNQLSMLSPMLAPFYRWGKWGWEWLTSFPGLYN